MPEIKISFSGPFFASTMPGKVKSAIEDCVQEVIERGEQKLAEMLRPRPAGVYLSVQEAQRGKASTGHYRRSIHGERHGTLGRIHDSGVRYGAWLEGVSSRNQTTRFKGYHSFAKTVQFLQKESPRIVEKRIKRLANDLS